MTATITSSLRIGIVAGTGVRISGPVVPEVTTDDIFNADNPTQTLTELIGGLSSTQLVGTATLDGTTIANTAIYTVPANDTFIPTAVIFALTGISGSGEPPAVNVGFTGTYQDLIDSGRDATFELDTATIVAPGSGYAATDTLTLVGGTFSDAADLTVGTTKLVTVALNAPGITYAPGNTVTLAGGTSSTKAIITVSTVKLVSATVNVGGSGYGNIQTFNVTIAGGTSTSAATVNVTTDSGGIVTTINSVTGGSYTALPSLTGNIVVGNNGTDLGTGLTLNLVFGINTFTITTAGSYTVNTGSFTQFATSGSGSGATFNTGLFGVNTVSTFDAGTYSVLPTGTIATTGGSGTGCTVTAAWLVLASLFSNIDTVGQLLSITDFSATAGSTGADFEYLTGGDVLKARVAFPSTYDDYTIKCFVFGFLTQV